MLCFELDLNQWEANILVGKGALVRAVSKNCGPLGLWILLLMWPGLIHLTFLCHVNRYNSK